MVGGPALGRAWRLLAAMVLVFGAAAAGLALLVGEGGDPRSQQTADPPPPGPKLPASLSELPKLGKCLDEADTTGEDDNDLDVDAISEKVEDLRELRFESEPSVEFLSEAELGERLRDLYEHEADREELELDDRLLTLLGAVPADADLFELAGDALDSQVAGLYDQRTKKMLVLTGEDPGALERIILAHELEHALADEVLGIPIADKPDPARADSLLARIALVEGDASLASEIYAVRHIGLGDLLGAADIELAAELDRELAKLPYHLQRELIWPYVGGAEFVCSLYARGGWEAVDRAYRRPPASSDQILFPERYGARPASPPAAESPGPGWSLDYTGELGAAELMWLFEAPGGEPKRALPDPRGSVSAWRGGRVTLWGREGRSAAGISLAEPLDSRSMCVAVAGWYASAFPEGRRPETVDGEELAADGTRQAASLRCPAGGVRLGIAPTLATARRLSG